MVRRTTEWGSFGSHGCNGISTGEDGYYIVSQGLGQGGKTKPLHWMGAFLNGVKMCRNDLGLGKGEQKLITPVSPSRVERSSQGRQLIGNAVIDPIGFPLDWQLFNPPKQVQ